MISRLQRLQTQFAAHIRDPENRSAPDGIEDRRMKIYRELFFNNIQSLLATNFPVLRQLYSDEDWRSLVRDFYSRHHSKTPLFPEVAKEFLQYLQDERKREESDPPFLHELAHYEWVELALELDEREAADVPANPSGDLLKGIPVISPLAWPLSYRFPVHRIQPDFQPKQAPDEPTHLLVYRNDEDQVKFMQLNSISLLLLQRIKEGPGQSGRELLECIAIEIGHPAPGTVIEGGAQLMKDFRNRGVLLGTRKER
jgi:hypothetical protein